MWVHLINIKRQEFRKFSHLYRYLLEDEVKFLGPFRRTSSNATVRLSVAAGGTGNAKTKRQL
jgi:hypothetical protein